MHWTRYEVYGSLWLGHYHWTGGFDLNENPFFSFLKDTKSFLILTFFGSALMKYDLWYLLLQIFVTVSQYDVIRKILEISEIFDFGRWSL